MYQHLPPGALEHDQNAYLATEQASLTQLGGSSAAAVM